MKVVFLAVAYRMSAMTLGQSLNISETLAQQLIDTLFAEFPDLKIFIEENVKYALEHEGYINTLLGDTLRANSWRMAHLYDPVTGKMKLDKQQLSKTGRAGINYKIQEFSSIALASGFDNATLKARESKFLCTNICVVHDSCQNLVDVNKIFDIREFYDREFREFCYENYGINFQFDLDISVDYDSFVTLKRINNHELTLTGTAENLEKMIQKIQRTRLKTEITEMLDSKGNPVESLKPEFIDHPIDRFITTRQCCMVKDTSEYTIRIIKK